MKKNFTFCYLLASFAIVSCESMNQPISGDFNPLSQPGIIKKDAPISSSPQYNAGTFVVAASNSTGFFITKPKGNADAQELLTAGTSMRVIKNEGSYLKIELDNGKIGYVNSIMVSDKSAIGTLPIKNAAQVYPLTDGVLPTPGGESAATLPSDTNPNSAPIDAAATDMKPELEVPKVKVDSAPSIATTELPATTNQLPPSAADLKKEAGETSQLKIAIKEAATKTKETVTETPDKLKKP
jgi:hypothetical protein